jgi:hypothetical protein
VKDAKIEAVEKQFRIAEAKVKVESKKVQERDLLLRERKVEFEKYDHEAKLHAKD